MSRDECKQTIYGRAEIWSIRLAFMSREKKRSNRLNFGKRVTLHQQLDEHKHNFAPSTIPRQTHADIQSEEIPINSL